MLQLNSLESVTKKRKRVGRGGSRGGHSGRGKDGQKCRSGAGSEIKAWFEGGQMPLSRRLPRRGFNNPFKKEVTAINLEKLEACYQDGETVDLASLRVKRLVRGKRDVFVKILGVGSLSKRLNVQVNACSKTASDAITNAGGSVQLIGENESGGSAS
jgi:large subunit ribosomal protein L15